MTRKNSIQPHTGAGLPSLSPVVKAQDGQAVTTSQEIAKYFHKRHKNVLRAIENLLPQLPEHSRLNFEPLTTNRQDYINSGSTAIIEGYRLTRNGFVLLAMGFTGKKAMQFKVAYIDAFNAMEDALLRDKVWIGGLTQALEKICPTPPTEADAVRNQRAVKTLRALAAYWAMLEEMPLSAAESAVCAVGRLGKLDDFNLARQSFGELSDFLERAMAHSNKDAQPATEEQIHAIKCLVEACAQFKYSRDRNIYDLLREDYGVSIEAIMAATSGEAKRLAGIAYNMLHQNVTQTMVINEIKRRAQKADGKDEPKTEPRADDDQEERR